MKFKYIIKDDTKVSDFLTIKGFSRKALIKLKKEGIMINGIKARTDQFINKGDLLEITLPNEESDIIPIDKPIEIIYEDEYILCVNKPHNLAIIGTKRHYDNNLSSFIYSYFIKNNIASTVHLINRLDKNTSGIVLVAKSAYIHHLFKNIEIKKKYYCLVHGILDEGIIEKNIIKANDGTIKRKIDSLGKYAKTQYKAIYSNNNKSILDVTLHTGRTHQIRLHLSSIGHPIYGDDLYGESDGTLLLQSYYMEFIHPITNKHIILKLDIDKDIKMKGEM